MAEPKWLKDLKEEDYIKEDFDATGKSRYTVEGLSLIHIFFVLSFKNNYSTTFLSNGSSEIPFSKISLDHCLAENRE